ncbi:P-loop containing nucleoside triphosphate hydrolase protein [Boletus coccyginus]|nr:P-loop containing nucleoside triphosphate hydrolase protein [Boletus coccyginus]
MGHLIKHILSSTSSVTVYDVLNGPGGRHDNDFADFRDIAILPTTDEILCRKPPFLRTAYDDELETSETPVKDYLDNTFRMLREDMLFDIRQEVRAALQKDGKYRGLRVTGVSMVGVYTGTSDRKTRWGIKLQCDSDFWQLRGIKDDEDRVNFLERDPHGSKILRHQSLVCLASGEDIISFGTVNRVEELLAANPPVIVLQLDGDVNVSKTLTSLRMAQTVQLIQIDTATFAFEPVLSALKMRSTIPLSEEILFWNSESPLQSCRSKISLSHIANALISDPSLELDRLLDLPKRVSLDKAQARSLVAGLQQRVSLIQGPPGTGKSFIGALLAKAIHDETAQTILVVCYTNHALDQFLGDLLKHDIPDESIVRLGGRSNQATDHLALHRQPRGFSYDWEEINNLRSTASYDESELQSHFDALLDIGDRNLLMYLEHEYDEFYDAFYVPLETEDGMTRVGRNGQAIDSRYLFSRWIRGLDAGVLSGEPHIRASAWIWGMARSARQQRLDKWRHELVTEKLELLCSAGRPYNRLQDKIKQQFASATVTTLQQKRIIACTTTGAAIYADVLERVGPEVLLVEEAGEILESHILIALSHNVDQMILIGDHKQLRPKVNNHQLTVEKGEGFDLNRSLFERLVLKGYPHVTLSTQHRMRPEISAFVRELTYPELINAPSTYGRPDIRGLQSNVIFVDHNHPEDDDSLISDRADGGTKASKQNTYEVQMVLKIVRYLGQQGYNSENIVVLTPYLGQLHRLRDTLKRNTDPILNDMDSLDLARAGLSLFAPPDGKAKKGRIHLATIDNYQGEESDIVVASLTRSNKSNMIGFMDSPERLNVLLSRARNGLILIGNSQTFLHSRKGGALWKRCFTLLEKGQYVFQGFPVRCQRHTGHIVLLKGASDFDDHCPDGGCTEPW